MLEGPRNYGIRTAECSLGTAITDGETVGRSLALSSLLIASTQPKVAELVGGIDSLRNNASTDEGASMLKGHPKVNASVDWGRKPTIEPSRLQLGRNS